MAESKMRDENYYQIQGWMINRLGLKGITLSVYAIIYGFTQDGENEYTGSLQYLCDFTGGVSKPTIIKALKELVESELILRREEIINNVQFNRYKVNLPLLKKFNGGGKETLTGVVKNFNGGSKETLPNNNIYNNSFDNKNNNKNNTQDKIEKLISDYTTDEQIGKLLHDWLNVRKAKRGAMTERAIELNLNKLDRLARESKMTVAVYLEEVICRGWQAFYPINNYTNKYSGQNDGKTYGTNGIAVNNDTSELDNLFT